MSFDKFKDTIEQGDTVILYMRHNNMHAIQVQPKIKNKKDEWVENVFQTTYGALKVQSLVGKKYGSKVYLSKGWAYVLHPTPELWTLTLPHRTQIIYTPDISMIIFQLEIKPGSVVIECGTGSGSLSHALIRCIMPHGHLYTFDFHELRVSVVHEEFESHGIGQFVTVEQRDVCQDGFGTELNGKVDAVFLDIPHPWEAVPHAAAAFKDVATYNYEICALLGYNTASSGNPLPSFRDNVSVPSSRVKKSKKSRAASSGNPLPTFQDKGSVPSLRVK